MADMDLQIRCLRCGTAMEMKDPAPGAPWQPELGIGAIAPNGIRILSQDLIRMLDVSEAQLEAVKASETREMERRLKLYRGDKPLPDLRNNTAILVDDGLATGVSDGHIHLNKIRSDLDHISIWRRCGLGLRRNPGVTEK